VKKVKKKKIRYVATNISRYVESYLEYFKYDKNKDPNVEGTLKQNEVA